MIGFIRGRFLTSFDTNIIIEVNGIGYEFIAGSKLIQKLGGIEDEIELHVHSIQKEDGLSMYVFSHLLEKRLFRLLLKVNGVGPRSALAIMDELGSTEMIRAVLENRHQAFKSVSGIGQKTAQKIILELFDAIKKNRLDLLPEDSQTIEEESISAPRDEFLTEDLISAMVNLGYTRSASEKALREIWEDGLDFQVLMKRLINKLSG